ncbi:hypothetical protein JL720_16878 [Aureococcus anophagefferens]|nr:hypothetical protein JL720_16878 [Aureococcus anophagefferens]
MGKCAIEPQGEKFLITPEKHRGEVRVVKVEDIPHFQWRSRETLDVDPQMDHMVFPATPSSPRSTRSGKDDRVYLLQFKAQESRRFFWMQNKDASDDDELEAKDESKTQREACSVCGAESRRECPCGTRRYCSDDSTRCPVCEEIFDPNYYKHHVFRVCCQAHLRRCDIGVLKATAPLCPLCESPAMTHAELALLRRRVDEHEPNAMVQLGHKHQRARRASSGRRAALALYQRAADYGDLRAMVHLGLAYVNSRGTPKDERLDGPAQRRDRQKGVDLLRLGGRGDAHCQYCLAKYAKAEFTAGACHLRAGVPEDEDKALRWFLRAAYRGHNEARQAVGVIRRHRPSARGTWRIEIPGPSSRIGELKAAIEAQKSVASDAQVLSAEPSGAAPLDDGATLEACGLGANGSMVFLAVAADRRDDVALPPPPTAKDDVGVRGAARVKIGADGSIFVFKVKRQEDKHCAAVSLDAGACVSFQGYVQQLGWRQQRVGFLYGTFDDGEARAEAVYEPPQDCSEHGFVLLEDDKAEAVAQLAQLLGLAAMEQLEAADGVAETPYVSVRVTVNEKGEANFEAYQVSQQCMAMVAERAPGRGERDVPNFKGSSLGRALAPDPDDAAACLVHETFTAIVEGKRAANVNTNFFLCNVPVKQHTSATFAATFPKENRMIPQTRDDLKVVLNKAKSTGAKLGDALADFGALLFLMGFPQIFDSQFMPAVCASVVDRTLPSTRPAHPLLGAGMDGPAGRLRDASRASGCAAAARCPARRPARDGGFTTRRWRRLATRPAMRFADSQGDVAEPPAPCAFALRAAAAATALPDVADGRGARNSGDVLGLARVLGPLVDQMRDDGRI